MASRIWNDALPAIKHDLRWVIEAKSTYDFF